MLKPILVWLVWFSVTAQAHEFWLAPNNYTPVPGDQVYIHWRVGEQFVGTDLIYLPHRTHAMGVIVDGQRNDYEARFAAKPVFDLQMPEASHLVVFTESSDYSLQYESAADFEAFIQLDRLTTVIGDAKSPQTAPIQERYRRYAKTLLGTEPTDVRVGMAYEWIVDWLPSGIQATLYKGSQGLGKRPVSLFYRDVSGTVTARKDYTNDAGEIVFNDLLPGEYLLNAIDMIPPNDTEDGAWYSHWASVTFYIQP